MKLKKILIVFAGFYLLYEIHHAIVRHNFITYDKDSYAEVNNPPLQFNHTQPPISFNQFILYPVADYKITALVLSKEDYAFGSNAKLVPVDLALGWNKMADAEILENSKIKISQSNRMYIWSVPNFSVLSRSEIQKNSANTHIIPMDDEIKDQINLIKKNDVVYLSGYLVNADDPQDHWKWKTSMTRDDVGMGACELMYVQEVKILAPDE